MRLIPLRFALALLICAAAVRAQSAESADSAAAEDSAADARHPRRWAISGETGINSLSSLVGPVFTYWARPALPLEFGVGLSSSGLRPGLRARYLFTPGDRTSFFGGAGLKFGVGSGGEDFEIEDPDTKEKLRAKTHPSAFADLMLGSEFLAGNGFLVVFNVGYSLLLGGDPYEFTSGSPSKQAKKVFDAVFGSGPMLSVSLGKAF